MSDWVNLAEVLPNRAEDVKRLRAERRLKEIANFTGLAILTFNQEVMFHDTFRIELYNRATGQRPSDPDTADLVSRRLAPLLVLAGYSATVQVKAPASLWVEVTL